MKNGVVVELNKEQLKKYRRKLSRVKKLCEKEGAQFRIVFKEE